MKVVGSSKDDDRNIIGKYDINPMLNTMVYDVEFTDGSICKYGANVIPGNMYSQVDSEGFSHFFLSVIHDYSKDKIALQNGEQYIISKSGQRHMRKSTVGWNLLIAWKYGSKQWIFLLDMKESNLIEVAKFSTAHGISDEPAFVWWVPHTLQKRDKNNSAVKSWVKQTTQKYGEDVPLSVEESYSLDTKNGNTLWRDALNKEISNLRVAFDILDTHWNPPYG